MPLELQMLALMTLLYAFAWLPAAVSKYQSYGLGWIFSDRFPAGLPPLPEWGQRAERAHRNLKENFPAFAVAVLLLALSGGFTSGTGLAAVLFVAARVLHFAVYVAGIVWLRTFGWALGLLATLYLLGMAVRGLVHF